MVWPFSSNSKDKDKDSTGLGQLVPAPVSAAVAQAHQALDETLETTMQAVDEVVKGTSSSGSRTLASLEQQMPWVKTARPYLEATAVFGAVAVATMVYRRRLRRVPSAAYLTPEWLQGRRRLVGRVTSVGDADNFRFYHTPGGVLAGWGWLRHVPTKNADLKGQTMHVRLAGVDAPEAAHFGMPAQPFSKEALEWLRLQLLGKTVVIQPYARDRYDRVVSMAWAPRFLPLLPKKNVSLEMLKVGYGQVYKQAGAEYGGFLAQFERAEAKARSRKKGIWSQKNMVSAAAHKKQHLRGGDNS